MAQCTSMCFSSPLIPQVLFYDGHERNFVDRVLRILQSHPIQYLILKSGDYVHDQPYNNGTNFKHKKFYGNEIMEWMRIHGTLNFVLDHMNSILVGKREYFKIPFKQHLGLFQEDTPTPPSLY